VEELARPEADRLPGHVADRPHDPAAETVVAVAALPRREQPRARELLEREPLRREGVLERVERLRGVADPEALGGRLIETAAAQEVAGGLRGRLSELGPEVLLGGGVRREQARPVAVVDGGGAPVLVVQLDADPRRHALDGLLEAHMVHALQEGEDVAVLAAAEAVVAPDAGPHMEARRALLVERAQTLERTDTGRLERHVVAHDVGDVHPGTDLVDVAATNQPGHALILGSSRAPWPGLGMRERRPGASACQQSRSCQAFAEGSVSEATWSTMTRLRAASSGAAAKSAAKPASRCEGSAHSASASSVRMPRCRS